MGEGEEGTGSSFLDSLCFNGWIVGGRGGLDGMEKEEGESNVLFLHFGDVMRCLLRSRMVCRMAYVARRYDGLG